ncbi:MAG: hypothetical protein HY817_00635 [Candidatus Abawacabacteria bacterium]|nr:hypothetical protein [Candidatus Abawacabacteria bacterium]
MTEGPQFTQFNRLAAEMEKYYRQLPEYSTPESESGRNALTAHIRNEVAQITQLRSASVAAQEAWVLATTKALIGASIELMRKQIRRQSAIGVGPGLVADGLAALAAGLVLSPATFDAGLVKELADLDDKDSPADSYVPHIQRAIKSGLLPADTDIASAVAAIEQHRKKQA